MSELYSLMSSTEKDFIRFDYKEQAKPKGARIWNDKLIDHYQSYTFDRELLSDFNAMKYTNICILVSQSHKIIEQSSNSILFSRYIYSLNMLFLSTQWTLFSTELDRGEGNKIVAHRHNIINIKWICLYPRDSRLARSLPCRYFLYKTTSYLF